ncbi:hypothetical protein L2E82_48879 [Cichorium intybus]|uniref:Uncharacterized protein n=1 Tax=Cichorium intybus TaxID=13427 RepID=A0ACB8YYS5_CICIN|nr:hypothetical protein L2E82_48879 [Cichorium intybus]
MSATSDVMKAPGRELSGDQEHKKEIKSSVYSKRDLLNERFQEEKMNSEEEKRVDVEIGKEKCKIRVKELDEKVYNPWNSIEKEGERNPEEQKGETEEEDSSEFSEFDSSDCFSDEKKEDENNYNNKEEKMERDGKVGPDLNVSNSPKSISPLKDFKPIECDKPNDVKLDHSEKVEAVGEERTGSPLNQVGLSDKLVRLLSRNTPIKEKLTEIEEEEKKEEKAKERNNRGVFGRNQVEKRITRSQTKYQAMKVRRSHANCLMSESESSMSQTIVFDLKAYILWKGNRKS